MRISKTLFKNFIRCANFPSLYDMYINRGAHNVTEIDGEKVSTVENAVNQMSDTAFTELDDKSMEIFTSMFDEETGVDLTNVTSAQLQAFAETFVEVERLAIKQASEVFNHDIKASTVTSEQQSFEFTENDNTYYCYLDGYMEDGNKINIFEVKATTSKKYDECNLTIRKNKNGPGGKFPLFVKDSKGIMQYVGDTYLGQELGGKLVTPKDLDDKIKRLTDLYSPLGKYIYDLAVERYIVEHSIDNKEKDIHYYLIVLNAEYIYNGLKDEKGPVYGPDDNGNLLFKIYDMTYITSLIQENVELKKKMLEYDQDHLTVNYHRFGTPCEYKKTTACKFFPICAKRILKDGSILEYMHKNYAFKNGNGDIITMYDLINQGVYMIPDARPYINRLDNITQYDCYVNNTTYIDLERIRKALNAITYPIFHLDFESYNSPLPRFKGENPYMQSLFQYSLHVEKNPGICDIVENHTEYLAPDHEDHREDLIKKLIHDIDLSNGGIVMVYNQNFEKTRLHELAKMFPKYAKELDNINDHIFDLLAVLHGDRALFDEITTKEEREEYQNRPPFTYYNNKMHGSFSIKKVLPIFTNLSYSNLIVKNGTEATLTYGLLPTLTPKEYEEKYLALRVYCRQDTWAMVEILRGLRRSFE